MDGTRLTQVVPSEIFGQSVVPTPSLTFSLSMTGTSVDRTVRCPGIQAHTSPSSQMWTGHRNRMDFTFLVRLVTWQRGKDFAEVVGLPWWLRW